MKFSDIIGNTSLKSYWINSVKYQRVAHAQLLIGKEGSPQFALALALASYLHCNNKGDSDACGQCPSCKKAKKNIHPDTYFFFPISTTKHIKGKEVVCKNFMPLWRKFIYDTSYGSINDWANYIEESKQLSIVKEEAYTVTQLLKFQPLESNYTIVIFWLPEYMHMATANALLKLLEEPPIYTIFLLVSNDVTNVLQTIVSRMQKVYIEKFTEENLACMLTKQYPTIPNKQLLQTAYLSEGNIQKALQLISDNHRQDENLSQFIDWMRLCYQQNFTLLVEKAIDFQKTSKTQQNIFLLYALYMMRGIVLYFFLPKVSLKLTVEEYNFVQKFIKIVHLPQVVMIINWLNLYTQHLSWNVNAKLLYINLSLKIIAQIHQHS